ncbi:ABC transporter ATP-binding protein [Butyricimonas virosa]|jgi:ABC transporter related|uniref:ATP-binding cassette domain-containing protein n=1 Tax=Butyricimonas virosa TaxID=544645 RepID=A0A413IIQ7_9BACT|nr:ATP-binding cassette domain-containing protein [Butyricimonas virosa]MCI7163711.1 ATP-binding cassette domain-containing protein [Butyricimonas virosa]MDY5014281.1 ATP-binding cassette domain-containing protein [Butyricimonas virosa]RGL85398.1 ATP-binding cassette domain-containing protein [Butyricimonas virosa]RGY12567.1 ATP-binding cassette domain-containing protein [Butyricimonas virosa]RHI15246.1 ATP-binding cassette domain-containing protein [Butyricimonas virosa]
MENPIVKVERLYHRYTASRWAIEDINFQISEAGVVGLLGSNGAGKSTTMNIICGVLKQTSGEVYINGINTLKEPVKARKMIGFLPQKPPLYPDLTINEYLRFCAEIQWMDKKKIKSAIARAEERCGITHMKDRLLRNLSGGYQQRVGLAQAILHDPKFVVLDEPTNGLDPNQILEVRQLIKDIAIDRTVMLSTHILSEVQATCSSIKMIEHGRVVFSGSTEDFDNYIEPNTLYLEFELPPTMDELLKLSGVKRGEVIDNHAIRLWYDGERDTIKQIMREATSRGWDMIELRREKSSMEAVFAKLSGK